MSSTGKLNGHLGLWLARQQKIRDRHSNIFTGTYLNYNSLEPTVALDF